MAEWTKAAVLKTVEAQASVGSNPTLSAIFIVSTSVVEYVSGPQVLKGFGHERIVI